VSLAVLMVALAIVGVGVGVSLIVQLDGRLVRGSRFVTAPTSGLKLPGLRAQHRAEHKASPVLFLLVSVLALLVIATLV
jgi:hypothetical protein